MRTGSSLTLLAIVATAERETSRTREVRPRSVRECRTWFRIEGLTVLLAKAETTQRRAWFRMIDSNRSVRRSAPGTLR